jgi:membrane-associated phospholipid phosphatase
MSRTASPLARALRHARPALVWGLLTAAMVLLFRTWPELDLATTALFYRPGEEPLFPWGELVPVQAMYLTVPWIGRIAFVVCLILLWRWRHGVPNGPLQRWRGRARVLAIVLLVGLAGVVNAGLKEHVGRPRPINLQVFGGEHAYQPVGRVTTLCERNCSFVSGHAATGFTLMACGLLGSVATRRRWTALGILAGGLIGAGRIVQGGHFLSDVIFAGLVMAGVCLLLRAIWVRRRWRRRQAVRRSLPGHPA